MPLSFSIKRRIRVPGGDWEEYRVEAECRHFADVRLIWERTKDNYAFTNPVDFAGRQVQAEYRLLANATGETLQSFIVGV